MELFELTKALVTLPSPTGKEKKVIHFLKEYLQSSGFTVELQEVREGRANVYAFFSEPDVVMSTHADTVSPYVPYSEDSHFIYGRGACDAKGIMAAQIKAAERLWEEGIPNIGLLFVVGEEKGSEGARAANTIPNRCRYLIEGEPTENKLAVASKGALRLELVCTGQAAHSACPNQGDSAIVKLLDVLSELRKASFPEHELLGETTVNIGTISGGTHANVVPDRASAELIFRTVVEAGKIKKQLEGMVKGKAEIHYAFESDPVFLGSLEGFEKTVVSFATDIPLLTHWGKPLLLGPGSILDAHSLGERMAKKELIRAVDLYCQIVKIVLNRKQLL